MAKDTTVPGAKAKARRTVKPKDVFMLYQGEAPNVIGFTKNPLEVLEKCGAGDGTKYIKVNLPAPQPRARASA